MLVKWTQGVWSNTRYTTHRKMCYVIRCNVILARLMIFCRPICGVQSKSVMTGPRHWLGLSLIDVFQKYVLCKFVWHFSFWFTDLRNEIKSLGWWLGVWYAFGVYVVEVNFDQYFSRDTSWRGMDSKMWLNYCCWESVAIHWPIKEKIPWSFKIASYANGQCEFSILSTKHARGLRM